MAIRNKEDLKATVAERVLTQQLLVDLIDSSTDTGVGSDLASHESNTTDAHGIDALMNKASSSTANNIVLFSDTSGKNVKNSIAKITSNGSIISGTNLIVFSTQGIIPDFIIGKDNEISGQTEANFVFGENNSIISSDKSCVIGSNNNILGSTLDTCLGYYNNIVSTQNCFVIGNDNEIADASGVITIGYNIKALKNDTIYIKNTNIKLEGNLSASGFKSGASQVLAGASAGEIWIDTADNTLKVGV